MSGQPTRWERTGEFRTPRKGEWFECDARSSAPVTAGSDNGEERWILREVAPVSQEAGVRWFVWREAHRKGYWSLTEDVILRWHPPGGDMPVKDGGSLRLFLESPDIIECDQATAEANMLSPSTPARTYGYWREGQAAEIARLERELADKLKTNADLEAKVATLEQEKAALCRFRDTVTREALRLKGAVSAMLHQHD
jgi:hypothetical protein